MSICPKCGSQNEDNAVYCRQCAAPLKKQHEEDISVKREAEIKFYKNHLKSRRNRKIGVGAILFLAVLMVLSFVVINGNRDNQNTLDTTKLQIADSSLKTEDNEEVPIVAAETEEESKNSVIDNFKDINFEDEVTRICESVKEEYGIADGEWFFSCDQATEAEKPDTAAGYISHLCQDINNDGVDELFVSYIESNNWMLFVNVYQLSPEGFQLQNEIFIDNVGNFSQLQCYLFQNAQTDEWQICYCMDIVGSYLEEERYMVRLFGIDNGSEADQQWYWSSFYATNVDGEALAKRISEAGIPWADIGKFSFGNKESTFSPVLAASEIDITGVQDEPALRAIYMRILDEADINNINN